MHENDKSNYKWADVVEVEVVYIVVQGGTLIILSRVGGYARQMITVLDQMIGFIDPSWYNYT
jgi:hypothetical protein